MAEGHIVLKHTLAAWDARIEAIKKLQTGYLDAKVNGDSVFSAAIHHTGKGNAVEVHRPGEKEAEQWIDEKLPGAFLPHLPDTSLAARARVVKERHEQARRAKES